MTDTNTLAPTDAELMQVIKDVAKNSAINRDGSTSLRIARAVLAKWGTPAPASQPVAAPAGMEPVAWIEVLPGLDGWFLAYSFNPDAKTEPLYTAAQVQAMLAAAPRNAPLYSPDDVAFPVQRSAEGVDVPPELASTARPTSIAAMEVTAPSGPAHKPLTDEQIDEIHLANSDAYERGDVEYESHGFARAIEHHHGIAAAQKGGQHGF